MSNEPSSSRPPSALNDDTGVRASVARTVVSFDVDLGAMVTLRTLEDGLRECIRQLPRGERGERA